MLDNSIFHAYQYFDLLLFLYFFTFCLLLFSFVYHFIQAIEIRKTCHAEVFTQIITPTQHVVYGSPSLLKKHGVPSNILDKSIEDRLKDKNVEIPEVS